MRWIDETSQTCGGREEREEVWVGRHGRQVQHRHSVGTLQCALSNRIVPQQLTQHRCIRASSWRHAHDYKL